jgi:hypothetical protein
VAVQHGDDILDAFNDGIIRVRPEVAEGITEEFEEASGGEVWFSTVLLLDLDRWAGRQRRTTLDLPRGTVHRCRCALGRLRATS